jgi:hypothetical protein
MRYSNPFITNSIFCLTALSEIDFSSGMRKDDARKLDHKTLEEILIRAVKRIQQGERPEIIARVLRVDRSFRAWLKMLFGQTNRTRLTQLRR